MSSGVVVRGPKADASEDVRVALNGYREGIGLLVTTVRERGHGIRCALEPSWPRGHVLLPTIGDAIEFMSALDSGEIVGVNPGFGHERTIVGHALIRLLQRVDLEELVSRDPGARGVSE